MAGNKPGAKDPAEPKSILEALNQGLGYDEAGKKAADAAVDATKPAAKPAEKAPAAKPGDKTAVTDATEIAAPKVKAKADAANALYAMPEGLQPQARDRFKALTDGHRQISEKYETAAAELATVKPQVEQLIEQRDSFRQILEETETGTDRFNEFFSYQQALKDAKQSKDYTNAIALAQAEVRRVCLLGGVDPESISVDPLDDFPDLAEEVANSAISRERAMEIARGRVGAKQAERVNAGQREAADHEARVKASKDKAIKEISVWAQGVRAADIDYPAKQAKLLTRITAIMNKYPPAQWLTAIQDAYDTMEAPPAPKPNGKEPHTPLRPSGGGGKPAPASILDAIELGLGYRE